MDVVGVGNSEDGKGGGTHGIPHHISYQGDRCQATFFCDVRLLRSHERTGTPLGSEDFIDRLETATENAGWAMPTINDPLISLHPETIIY